MNQPITVTELISAAAKALIQRDTLRIEELRQINNGWLQTADEEASQNLLLTAILEAACLLESDPSEIQIHDETAD